MKMIGWCRKFFVGKYDKGMGTDYYVPFARYLLEQDTERKYVMQQVRETGDYDVWIRFFLKILELAYMRTNQMLMQLEQIHKDTVCAISGEKQKAFLQDVMFFMEDNPIFGIGDIEKLWHGGIVYCEEEYMVLLVAKEGEVFGLDVGVKVV